MCCREPPYCGCCWADWQREKYDEWLAMRKVLFLDQPLRPPQSFSGLAVRDYGGTSVQILQIGLGTFGTFLHQDVPWIDVLLEATDWRAGEPLRGIGVDVNEDSAGPAEHLALERHTAASVMLAAVGEYSGSVSLYCLPRMVRLKLRQEMEERGAEMWKRIEVDAHLAYLENMSSVGTPHCDFQANIKKVSRLAGTEEELVEERSVPMYTFYDVLALHKASSCDVLVIDAEGADCAILRSVLDACRRQGVTWPRVLRFETRGHADLTEEQEEATIERLQDEGYLVLDVGGDATLVYGPALQSSSRLARWSDKHFTLTCYSCKWRALPSSPGFAAEVGAGYSQWRGTAEHRASGLGSEYQPWCCLKCAAPEAAADGGRGTLGTLSAWKSRVPQPAGARQTCGAEGSWQECLPNRRVEQLSVWRDGSGWSESAPSGRQTWGEAEGAWPEGEPSRSVVQLTAWNDDDGAVASASSGARKTWSVAEGSWQDIQPTRSPQRQSEWREGGVWTESASSGAHQTWVAGSGGWQEDQPNRSAEQQDGRRDRGGATGSDPSGSRRRLAEGTWWEQDVRWASPEASRWPVQVAAA